MAWSKAVTMGGHGLLGLLLFQRALKTDLTQSKALYKCYMFLWKLFYAEYLLIPLLR